MTPTPEQAQAARAWIDSLADGPYTEGTYTSLAALLAEREAAAHQRGSFQQLQVSQQYVESERAAVIERCAKVAESMWPRGSAHTYASENADRYIALEDAGESIAFAIRAFKEQP